MEPFFFGPSDKALYGVYHPPEVNSSKSEAVLFCPPFGQEYMRSHRALRQLALLLNKKGYHVLRFDYSGTGDSNGNMEDMLPQTWVNDIATAANELIDMADVKRITLVGLRLGALFSVEACKVLENVSRLVLWDPIISGKEYIEELSQEIQNTESPDSKFIAEDGSIFFNGFPLGKPFQKNMESMTLIDNAPQKCEQILQIVSHENGSFQRLKENWKSQPGYTYKYIHALSDWNYVDRFGGILLPQPIIQGIVNFLP